MISADTTITVTIAPHWINGWFLRATARPVVQVDGDEHVIHWRRPITLPVAAGHHRIRAFFRYRGFRSALGSCRREIEVEAGDSWTFVAEHGLTNGSGLSFREVSRA